LLALGSGDDEPATLAEAENERVPGPPESWGGHGGKRLGDVSTSIVRALYKWIHNPEQPDRKTKYARVALACDIVAADRADRAESAGQESEPPAGES
jgi:hypothetical protein